MEELSGELKDVSMEEEKKKESTFNFVHVLPAVLELISAYLDGYDIMAMYRTNSHALELRMRLAIREIRIKRRPELPSWDSHFWSVLKACSYLRSVSLSDPTLSIWKHGPKFFDQLPKSLERLHIHLPFLFGDYLLAPTRKAPHTPTHKHIQALATSNHFYGGQMPSWDLENLLPNLIAFSVAHASSRGRQILAYGASSRRKVIKQFFKCCPISLKEISLPENFDGAMALPQTVTAMKFTLSDDDSIEDMCKNVPSHLVSLELHTTRSNEVLDFSSLPPHLERLSLSNKATSYDSAVDYRGFKNLSLVSLSINCQYGYHTGIAAERDVFADLPPQLTELYYESNRGVFFDFANLPQGLTSLEVIVPNPQLIPGSVLCFPPKLTKLVMSSFRFTSNDIFRMPRTLTSLEMSFYPTISQPTFYTDVDASRFLAALDDPRELRQEGNYTWHDGASLFLPPKLLYLRINRSQLGEYWFKHLPVGLISLTINTMQALGKNSLDNLPDTLTELNIVSTGGLQDCSIENLPESLERLSIECMVNKITDNVFRKLPRSLLYFALHHNNNIHDEKVEDLPRLLTHFIAPNAELLSSKCAPKLPRFLCVLQLKRFILANPRPPKSEILAQMPPFVQAYDLRWTNPKGSTINFEAISN
jgi:hypothetical protein